jgi:hypothetical protein
MPLDGRLLLSPALARRVLLPGDGLIDDVQDARPAGTCRAQAGAMRVGQYHQVSSLPEVRLEQRDHVGLLSDDQSVLVRLGGRQRQEEAACHRAEDGHASSLPGHGRFQGPADDIHVPLEFPPCLRITG